MNTTAVVERFEKVLARYLQELDGYSIEELRLKPSDDEWSLGQMYMHLIQSALNMHLSNAVKGMGLHADTDSQAAEKTEAGKAAFSQGSFPPVRIKVPASPQYTPQQPASKEQIIEGMNSVLLRMKELAPSLETASLHHTIAHPGFGALNAMEWFMLVEMHYRHHLLQMDRLKKHIELCGA